jgi:hypothetical protein
MRVDWRGLLIVAIAAVPCWAAWVAVQPEPARAPSTIPAPVYESSR